jgi:hypothetical protein
MNVESTMSHRKPLLSIVEPSAEELRERFRQLTGHDPTPTELKVFARWKVTLGMGLPLTARRSAARVISRF